MTTFSHPLLDASGVGTTWPDDVADLTDRRRLLVLAVLGVDLPGSVVDQVFVVDEDPASSTADGSGGRPPRSDDE